jgi:hypothetical protein
MNVLEGAWIATWNNGDEIVEHFRVIGNLIFWQNGDVDKVAIVSGLLKLRGWIAWVPVLAASDRLDSITFVPAEVHAKHGYRILRANITMFRCQRAIVNGQYYDSEAQMCFCDCIRWQQLKLQNLHLGSSSRLFWHLLSSRLISFLVLKEAVVRLAPIRCGQPGCDGRVVEAHADAALQAWSYSWSFQALVWHRTKRWHEAAITDLQTRWQEHELVQHNTVGAPIEAQEDYNALERMSMLTELPPVMRSISGSLIAKKHGHSLQRSAAASAAALEPPGNQGSSQFESGTAASFTKSIRSSSMLAPRVHQLPLTVKFTTSGSICMKSVSIQLSNFEKFWGSDEWPISEPSQASFVLEPGDVAIIGRCPLPHFICAFGEKLQRLKGERKWKDAKEYVYRLLKDIGADMSGSGQCLFISTADRLPTVFAAIRWAELQEECLMVVRDNIYLQRDGQDFVEVFPRSASAKCPTKSLAEPGSQAMEPPTGTTDAGSTEPVGGAAPVPLRVWLESISTELVPYAEPLLKCGGKDTSLLLGLQPSDAGAIADEIGMKMIHRLRFIRAVEELNSAEIPPRNQLRAQPAHKPRTAAGARNKIQIKDRDQIIINKQTSVPHRRVHSKDEKPHATLSEGEVVDVWHEGEKKLFPGKIAKVLDDGSYDITYDDSTEIRLSRENTIGRCSHIRNKATLATVRIGLLVQRPDFPTPSFTPAREEEAGYVDRVGSGVIINNRGAILTAAHNVVDLDAKDHEKKWLFGLEKLGALVIVGCCRAESSERTVWSYHAKVIAYDEDLDVAVLQLAGAIECESMLNVRAEVKVCCARHMLNGREGVIVGECHDTDDNLRVKFPNDEQEHTIRASALQELHPGRYLGLDRPVPRTSLDNEKGLLDKLHTASGCSGSLWNQKTQHPYFWNQETQTYVKRILLRVKLVHTTQPLELSANRFRRHFEYDRTSGRKVHLAGFPVGESLDKKRQERMREQTATLLFDECMNWFPDVAVDRMDGTQDNKWAIIPGASGVMKRGCSGGPVFNEDAQVMLKKSVPILRPMLTDIYVRRWWECSRGVGAARRHRNLHSGQF